MKIQKLKQTRQRRQFSIRKKVKGSSERPRLTIFRSNRHIYAQIVDDMAGVTLAAANTMQKSIAESVKHGGNADAAQKVGEMIAKEAAKVGISKVRFDRSGFKYHGRVKVLADAARNSGLIF